PKYTPRRLSGKGYLNSYAVFTFTPGKDDHAIAIVDQAAAGDESEDEKAPDEAAATPSSTTTPAATH
ncbi:hypothetical protein, partial [uncultured Thiodictyon sp.]|uniref:hypothetical protein n=1 Tax=uncultured Thiodictyon sp. TaxID=1846217 RepID=UPI0025F4B454